MSALTAETRSGMLYLAEDDQSNRIEDVERNEPDDRGKWSHRPSNDWHELDGDSPAASDRRGKVAQQARTPMDTFTGFVTEVEGHTAFLRMQTESGSVFYGEHPADDLERRGIFEHRRFICRTYEVGGRIEIDYSPVSDIEVTPKDEAAIDRSIDELLDDGFFDGNE